MNTEKLHESVGRSDGGMHIALVSHLVFNFILEKWHKLMCYVESPIKFKVIECCYEKHKTNCVIKFTFKQYFDFWIQHKVGDRYEMENMDGTVSECKVTYYPLANTYVMGKNGEKVVKYYDDLRALVEIEMEKGTDFREVPVHYLKRKNR